MSQLVSNNELSLENLSGRRIGNQLEFSFQDEKAIVKLDNNKIAGVTHINAGKSVSFETPIKTLSIGERNFQRYVEHFLIRDVNGKNLLRLGQTFHIGDGGTWSSLPHDFENYPEPGFEELFFYLLSGGSQRAIQVGKGMLFDGKEIDDAWIVNNNDFSQIPMGYHPVGGEPDVIVSYVWCYACKYERWEKV